MPVQARTLAALTFSLAAALALSGVAAAALAVKPTAAPAALAAQLPQVRRDVVWYAFPEANPHNLHIESTSTNASAPDEFQISYQGGNFTLVYQRAVQGPITTQYTLSVNALIEWNDTTGDGNFQDGTVVGYLPLGPSAFGRFPIVHSERTTADGIQVNSFDIPSNKGDITLNLTIADGFLNLPSGQVLTPMEAKLSLEINHTMTFPASRLSLQMGIATDQTISLGNQSWDDVNEFSSDDHAVNVTNEAQPAFPAFFAWSNIATVNGQALRVTPSGLFQNDSMPGYYDLVLSYPRPADGRLQLQIAHDPTMGVVSAAYLGGEKPVSQLPFQSDAALYAISLVAVAALVAGTVLLMNRRRRKQA